MARIPGFHSGHPVWIPEQGTHCLLPLLQDQNQMTTTTSCFFPGPGSSLFWHWLAAVEFLQALPDHPLYPTALSLHPLLPCSQPRGHRGQAPSAWVSSSNPQEFYLYNWVKLTVSSNGSREIKTIQLIRYIFSTWLIIWHLQVYYYLYINAILGIFKCYSLIPLGARSVLKVIGVGVFVFPTNSIP